MIERSIERLSGWKARYLSKGGRLTLSKASLASIPIHFLSLLVMPRSVSLELDKIQRDFLWRRGEKKKRAAFGVVGEGLHSKR